MKEIYNFFFWRGRQVNVLRSELFKRVEIQTG